MVTTLRRLVPGPTAGGAGTQTFEGFAVDRLSRQPLEKHTHKKYY